MKRFAIATVALLTVHGALPARSEPATAETWPTPYTAEEIRDAWVEGFWVDTRTETPEGVIIDHVEVLEWSEEGAVLGTLARPEAGDDAAGASDADAEGMESFAVTWEELRSHAVFDKTTTARRRDTRETPLGTLEGWLYTSMSSAGSSLYFFADGLPGPPVLYAKVGGDGEMKLSATQLARHGMDAAADRETEPAAAE